jgi:hypothetical protein
MLTAYRASLSEAETWRSQTENRLATAEAGLLKTAREIAEI